MSEENNMNEDVVSYNFGGDVDISLPDIPLPTVQEKKDVKKDECEVAFKFGFIGAGQGGSRIAESFYNLGYRKLSAINTAQQDLNTIKLENKLCIGDGGAGKDPSKAEKLFNERKEDVLDFMRDSLIEVYNERIFTNKRICGQWTRQIVSAFLSSLFL